MCPPKIIALASIKGGCGKTTLAVNVAAGLARNAAVALMDADPQGSVRHWAAWSQDAALPEVIPVGSDVSAAIAAAARRHRRVVVDCPPSLDMAVTGRILEHVDAVLIPILPSPLDLWAGAKTAAAVAKARERNPRLRAWLLLNQVEPSSALSRAMAAALTSLEVPSLACVVRRRAAFRLAAVEGRSVYQLGARGRQAASDIDQVIEEVSRT